MFVRVFHGGTVGPLLVCKHPVKKAFALTLQNAPNPINFNNVGTDADEDTARREGNVHVRERETPRRP